MLKAGRPRAASFSPTPPLRSASPPAMRPASAPPPSTAADIAQEDDDAAYEAAALAFAPVAAPQAFAPVSPHLLEASPDEAALAEAALACGGAATLPLPSK